MCAKQIHEINKKDHYLHGKLYQFTYLQETETNTKVNCLRTFTKVEDFCIGGFIFGVPNFLEVYGENFEKHYTAVSSFPI